MMAVTAYLSSRGSADAGAVPGTAQTPIQHVVIILKENRSFDEYFGKFPGANGATTGKLSNGQTVNLAPTPDPMPQDIDHSPEGWATAYDNGKMDGFDEEDGAITSSGQDLAMTQMSQSQIPNYWSYANTYGLGDDMFSGFKGASLANNLFTFAAQAGQYDSAVGNKTVYSLPHSQYPPSLPVPWGCDNAPDTVVTMEASNGSLSSVFPCFDFPTVPDMLTKYGVSWNVFRRTATSPHNSLDAIQQDRLDPAAWSHVLPISQFDVEAKAGTLPNVSYIIPTNTEHPPSSACAGENETVSEVNALMHGADWSSSAVVIYWDEWGGFYDHVAPPQADYVSYGFRVPLLVISPFTKVGSSSNGGYISHDFYSQESVAKMIEDMWDLPTLTPRDANASDLFDFFDLSAAPRPKLILTKRACPSYTRAELHLIRTANPD